MNEKKIEITIDALGNPKISKQNLSCTEAISLLDYCRAQIRLEEMRKEEKNVATDKQHFPIYSY